MCSMTDFHTGYPTRLCILSQNCLDPHQQEPRSCVLVTKLLPYLVYTLSGSFTDNKDGSPAACFSLTRAAATVTSNLLFSLVIRSPDKPLQSCNPPL